MKWSEPIDFGANWNHRSRHPSKDYLMAPSNSMPTPYKELSLDDFLKLAYCRPYAPTGEQVFRQVMDLDALGTMWSVRFTHYNDYSLAVAAKWAHGSLEITHAAFVKDDAGGYGHYLRFFRVGCSHKYREVTPEYARQTLKISHYGNCYHVYECGICGHTYAEDSSG